MQLQCQVDNVNEEERKPTLELMFETVTIHFRNKVESGRNSGNVTRIRKYVCNPSPHPLYSI